MLHGKRGLYPTYAARPEMFAGLVCAFLIMLSHGAEVLGCDREHFRYLKLNSKRSNISDPDYFGVRAAALNQSLTF